jgi:hypothetical protein
MNKNSNSARLLASATVAATAVMASNAMADNLVQNGGFESGNIGFYSDYTYKPAPVSPYLNEGQYSIAYNANTTHPGFTATANSGSKALYANGASSTTQIVWETGVSIDAADTYRFQAMVCSLVPTTNSSFAPPSLAFEITADYVTWTTMGQSPALTNVAAGVWQGSYGDIAISGSGWYGIRLRNLATAGSGNDFGLDDVYFGLANDAPSVPAPGAAALIGLAGVIGGRRRRA